MYKHILGVFFILVCCHTQAAKYTKVLVDDPLAVCLDGSPGAYYVSVGTNPKEFMLYFQGGGWCGGTNSASTIESCYQRSKTGLGSSKSYPNEASFTEGVLSNNEKNSFKQMTKVYLKYCDGSGHQGSRSAQLSYKDAKLYFRGNNVTVAQFQSLEKKFGLFSNSTTIIVSGGSAGGLASFLWTEYVNKNAKSAKVYGVPDSGIFLNSANFGTKTHVYQSEFENLFRFSNTEIDPPTPQCVKKFPNQKFKCMFAENIYQQITAPIFPVESLYDTWSIPNIIGIHCLSGSSLQNCKDEQKNYIQQYHRNTSNLLFSIGSNNQNGFWSPVCADHVYMAGSAYYSQSFRVPVSSQFSIDKCLYDWIHGKEGQSHKHIDSGNWPDNKPCSGVKNIRQKLIKVSSQ